LEKSAGLRGGLPVILVNWEAEILKIAAPANSSPDPHPQNNQSKMNWGCGSKLKAPTLQVRSPKFKSQSHKKKKKERKKFGKAPNLTLDPKLSFLLFLK
jgi:hypothetical protein